MLSYACQKMRQSVLTKSANWVTRIEKIPLIQFWQENHMRTLFIASLMVLTGCQSDQASISQRRAAIETAHDQKCQQWGAKPGSGDYMRCRETLYIQAVQQDANRRQMAAAYFARQQQPLPVYQMPVDTPTPVYRPVNCTSSRIGTIINTSCN